MTAPTAERVAELLAELGDTPDAVADKLRALGVKGYRNDCGACPIAAYLAVGTDYAGIEVSGYSVFVDDVRATGLPQSVAGFIRSFDRGVYLDLVEASS